MSKLIRKVTVTFVSVATAVSLSGAGALVPIAHGQTTVADLQAQITQLLALIESLQVQLATLQGAPAAGTVPASLLSSSNLTVGSKGAVVKDLQMYLNANGAQVAASGPGSVGNETEFFGSLTKAALGKWQAANGVSPPAGFFGPITRAKLSSLSVVTPAPTPTTPTTPTTPVVVPQGTGLTVTLAAVQPVAALAPRDATRIPFTKVNLTASADGDVTVSSVTVRRTGLSADAAFAGLVLLDEAGIQLGLEKTLNSNHEAVLGEALTVKAGTTKTLTVSARRAGSGSRGGQTASFDVVSIKTSADVFGLDVPLRGATHTINETLTIGSLVSPAVGPLDPGGSQTKEIGTSGYTFSAIKLTAGSAEKIRLMSIRWNQTGSAAKSDLANIKTYVEGTTEGFGVVVSADGKFYTSTFGAGIVIEKGFSKEMSIKGDIAGGSARKIDFDVDKRSDVYALGETFGYGVLPADGSADTGNDDGSFNTNNPWFDAYEVDVTAGTITVSKWNGVEAQNIAINLAEQPMGGWTVDIKGEAVSVGSLVFRITAVDTSASAVGLDDIDNVSLVDENGNTLAGPVDPSDTAQFGTITFTDTITFPVGVTNLKMVGKLGTDFGNNDTIDASTTVSTDWSSVTGQTTGNTITPAPTSAVSGNLMTVKASALTISVSAVPRAQTVIAGKNEFEFARYILDTAASGEDLRLTSLPLAYDFTAGAAADLIKCKLYDGETSLVSGSNVVNPSSAGSSTSFIFDGTGLTLVKGTSKQLSLKCDIIGAATGVYFWGYDSGASPSPTGLVSGQSVAAADLTENDSNGQAMTAQTSGSLTVLLDSTASYVVVAPGQNVVLAKLKYSATDEGVDVKQVALQLSGAASNTPINMVQQKVSLWDGSTKVGEAVFVGDTATTSLTSFRVPKDGSRVLTIKGTIGTVDKSGDMNRSGDLFIVDYDGDNEGANGNYGTGVSSGQRITPSNNDSSSTGVRIMAAYPTFANIALSSTERKLLAGDAKTVYKFKVTANVGEISLAKWTFTVASSTVSGSNATTTKFGLYIYTDSVYSTVDSQINSDGLVNSGQCYNLQGNNALGLPVTTAGLGTGPADIYAGTGCTSGTTTVDIPSGETRWFKLVASIGALATSNDAIQVQLEGDAAFPVDHQAADNGDVGEMSSSGILSGDTGVQNASDNDLIWSPRSTSTSASIDDSDWTNGYGLLGLPGTNLVAETLTQ